MAWQDALRTVLESIYEAAGREGLPWAVVGSAATALQGCRIVPHDLDLLARDARTVFRLAELLGPFAAPQSPPGFFVSTREVPVQVGPLGGFGWHFGRWLIDGFAVEVAHIAPPDGWSPDPADGMWECGRAVWPHVHRVAFDRYAVPVVPLEIQAETNLARGRTESGEDLACRVAEIAGLFRRRGYNRDLLEQALRPAHLARFDAVMQR
jgi:hypothetical protein